MELRSSKNSSYKVAYTLDLFWTHFGIDEIVQEIKREVPPDYEWESFTCPFSEEEFDALGIYIPEWQIQNLITLGDQELVRVYLIQYIIDDSPLKQGLYTPGLKIPVMSSDAIK